MTVARHNHVVSLDGLRGLAAVGVVLMHVGERWGLHHFPNHLYLAVPFFFTLSGYVIARSYEQRLATSMSVKRFVAIRLIRLYPMLALSLLLAALLGAHSDSVISGLLMVPSVWAFVLFAANGPEWSLFLEMAGNLLHAAALPILSTRVLAIIVAVSGAATATAALKFGNLEVGWSVVNLWGGIALFLFTYFIGVLLFRLEAASAVPAPEVPLLALIAVYVVFAGTPQPVTGVLSALRDFLCAAVVLPIVVTYAVRATVPAWLARLCKVGGDVSYPLYVLHHPIVTAVGVALADRNWGEWHLKIVGLLVVALCFGIAYAFMKLFDEPVRAWLSRWLLARPLTQTA